MKSHGHNIRTFYKIEKSQIFDTEIAMMTDTLKKMNEMLGYESRLSAQVLHVRLERPLCLIVEDLATLGYRMADRQAGLDYNHSILAIRRLATFHATSVALCEKEPKHKAMYRKGMFNDSYPEEMADFFIGCCMAFANEVETWPQFGKSYADKIRNLAPHLYKKGSAVVARNDDEFNVINHGDCWVNNMLFRYDENSKPVQQIFVDFQLCIYTSPAIDLHYFLSTSPSDHVSEHYMDVLLDEYLQQLSDMMKQLGCKTPTPTMSQLQMYMKQRMLYAFISSLGVLPLILTDQSEVKDLDEIMSDKDGYNSAGMRSSLYRKIMSKRLPKYLEMGLLDL
ncbi:uncharacterized protein LOC143183563 isoform X2 [Calliopsis andreniformis]|uniref:uncharacterized protein LOC143183563 isoform X2 n=1 Tax=Calliopsis andreniformis TaxID=337506 RepID=UPI003FCE1118